MQEQLPLARGLMIGIAAMAVRIDMDVVDPHFAAVHAGVAVAQVDVAFADRFHFGALELDAGLERLQDVVVVERLAVLSDALLRQLAFGSHKLQGTWYLVPFASCAASLIASIRLEGSAVPVPAMSNAVPWSTDVRTIGRPRVTLTARPKATSLIGINP